MSLLTDGVIWREGSLPISHTQHLLYARRFTDVNSFHLHNHLTPVFYSCRQRGPACPARKWQKAVPRSLGPAVSLRAGHQSSSSHIGWKGVRKMCWEGGRPGLGDSVRCNFDALLLYYTLFHSLVHSLIHVFTQQIVM